MLLGPMRFDREALKRLREERGFTQRQLGDAAGINASTISQLELGQREPLATTFVE
jgi:transcriptional regulator with XRE-family HTH domain